MTSVAGVPFEDLWRWRCPGRDCSTVLTRNSERGLERAAGEHWDTVHGVKDHPMLDFQE